MTFIASLLLGLCSGSFANVYFYRIPNGLSLWKPNSFCPQCNQPIFWRDNIPLLSYLLLRGKCRSCKSNISGRYPLVESLCAILFLLVTLRFKNESNLILTAYLIFSFLLFLIAGIDLVTYFQSDKQYGIIPDHLIWILTTIGLLFTSFNPVIDHSLWLGAASGCGGGLFMFLFRWAAGKIYKRESLG